MLTLGFGVPRVLLGVILGIAVLSGTAAASPSPAAAASYPVLSVPDMHQDDPQWADQELGYRSGVTLGAQGCAVTALAMVYAYFGNAMTNAAGSGMDPSILNAWLQYTANSIAWSSDDVPPGWGSLARVDYRGGESYSWWDAFAYSDRLADVTNELSAGHPVIGWVSSPVQSMHFVVITGSTGNNLTINDPAHRSETLFGAPAHYVLHGIRKFTPATEVVTVDDRSASGFSKVGPGRARVGRRGYAGSLSWGWSQLAGPSTVGASWEATLPETGLWRVFAWVPSVNAATFSADYVIDGREFVIPQIPYYDQWVLLGALYYPNGSTSHVSLTDVTGETISESIAFDAVKWVFVSAYSGYH